MAEGTAPPFPPPSSSSLSSPPSTPFTSSPLPSPSPSPSPPPPDASSLILNLPSELILQIGAELRPPTAISFFNAATPFLISLRASAVETLWHEEQAWMRRSHLRDIDWFYARSHSQRLDFLSLCRNARLMLLQVSYSLSPDDGIVSTRDLMNQFPSIWADMRPPRRSIVSPDRATNGMDWDDALWRAFVRELDHRARRGAPCWL